MGAKTENALCIPRLAVNTNMQRDRSKTVQVLDGEGNTQTRPIRTGISDGIRVEVLEGLKEGELVVLGKMTKEEVEAQRRKRGHGGPH